MHLKEILTMYSGGTPSMQSSEYWNGNIPFVSATSMHNTYISSSNQRLTEDGLSNGSRLLSKGNLLLLVRGSMLWNRIPICYNTIDVAFNQDVKGLIPNEEKLLSMYLLHWFQSKENSIKYLVSGTGIGAGKLDSDDILSFSLNLPKLDEQKRISRLFSLIDQRISSQNKIIQLLESLMIGYREKIFNREMRFKSINGNDFPDWVETKLEKVLKKFEEKSMCNNQYPVLTSARTGIYFQKDYFDGNEVASKDNTGYNVVPNGYFTYRHMSDDITFKFNINTICEKGIVSTLYPVFTTIKSNDYFIKTYLNEGRSFKNYALLQKQGGSRTYMYFSKLIELKLLLPCLEEQNRISSFLSSIEQKIETEKKILASYEAQKKYLLQNLFI